MNTSDFLIIVGLMVILSLMKPENEFVDAAYLLIGICSLVLGIILLCIGK